MEILSLEQLDEVRKTGFRPSVVACIVCNKKVLMVHKKEYEMWMLPQGGIANGETMVKALAREIVTELGADFYKKCKSEMKLLGEDQVEFLPEKQGKDELKTDDGHLYKMLGKKYYFCAVECSDENLDVKNTQFDDYHWFELAPGMFIAKKMKQPGKRRTTSNALTLMQAAGLVE